MVYVFIVAIFMIGSRTRFALLSGFFVFAFAMLFLAFLQSYAKAETSVLDNVRIVEVVNNHDR